MPTLLLPLPVLLLCLVTGGSTVQIGGVDLFLHPPTSPVGVAEKLASRGFIQRNGTQFVESGHATGPVPFYFMGFNAYWMIDKASWGQDWGRRQVAELLEAAQRLGMEVGRTWAFNTDMPKQPNCSKTNRSSCPLEYSQVEFEALDFIIYAAGRYNIRLILALGNLWPAYFGPERWLFYAKGSAADTMDVMDFYSDQDTRRLFRKHITAITNRVNVFTGVMYKDDPAIFGFDVMNEPRCPGFPDAVSQGIVHEWMAEMVAHLRAEDPNHLIAMGTEGFFMPNATNDLHKFNPGAGAQCEGEDWRKIGNLSGIDFSTLHVYERHMERIPKPPVGRSYLRDPDWYYCDFECYINWFVQYVQLHLEVNAQEIHKPIVLEEFGLTWWRSQASDLKVVVEVVRQMLLHSSKTNGAFAGAMIWNAAHNDSDDQDGYNVRIDTWPTSVTSEAPSIKYPMVPPIMGSYKPFLTQYDYDGQGRAMSMGRLLQETDADQQQPSRMRSLTWQQDLLDGFRRGWQRGDCAVQSSRTWRPMPLNTSVVDIQLFRSYTSSLQVVDILAESAQQLQAARTANHTSM